jgi:thiol-disulfide isomerase/thioredoxin
MPELAPLALGPIVLAGDRALVAIALVVGLLTAEGLARRRGHEAEWAWSALVVGLVAARVGWIVAHPQAYLARPLEVAYVWQGGFLAWAGIVAGLAWAAWRAPRSGAPRSAVTAPAVAAGLAAAAALAVLPVAPERPTLAAMEAAVRPLSAPETVEPVADWRGTPTVVNLWATWCGPCRRELPLLLEVAGDRDDVRLALVSQGESSATVAAYLAAEGLPTADVRIDPARALGTAVALAGYPTTLFVDEGGAVVEVAFGELSRARLLRGMAAIGVPARPAGAAGGAVRGRAGARGRAPRASARRRAEPGRTAGSPGVDTFSDAGIHSFLPLARVARTMTSEDEARHPRSKRRFRPSRTIDLER